MQISLLSCKSLIFISRIFYLIVDLAVVDTDDGANHFGKDDHVAQVGLHGSRLLENVRCLKVLLVILK